MRSPARCPGDHWEWESGALKRTYRDIKTWAGWYLRVGKNDLDFASVISSNESDYHCYYYNIYRMQSSLLGHLLYFLYLI